MRLAAFLATWLGLPGCYASHERPHDAAADTHDASGCTAAELPGTPVTLACPATVRAGEPLVVTLTHTVDACCREGAALPTEVRPGRDTPDFGLLASWSACDCCLTCGCVGTSATEAITVGTFERGVVHVSAGDLSCSVVVEASDCRRPEPWWVAPVAIRTGDVLPVWATASEGGCGCMPRVGGRGLAVEVELCGCCDACECIDALADATVVFPSPGPGPWTWTGSGGEPGPVVESVAAPESCVPARIVDLELGAPVPGRRSLTPNAGWVWVRTEALGCCVDRAVPWVGVEAGAEPLHHTLSAFECGADPCDCDEPRVVAGETAVFLGFLPSGEHRIDYGGPGSPFLLPIE